MYVFRGVLPLKMWGKTPLKMWRIWEIWSTKMGLPLTEVPFLASPEVTWQAIHIRIYSCDTHQGQPNAIYNGVCLCICSNCLDSIA